MLRCLLKQLHVGSLPSLHNATQPTPRIPAPPTGGSTTHLRMEKAPLKIWYGSPSGAQGWYSGRQKGATISWSCGATRPRYSVPCKGGATEEGGTGGQ